MDVGQYHQLCWSSGGPCKANFDDIFEARYSHTNTLLGACYNSTKKIVQLYNCSILYIAEMLTSVERVNHCWSCGPWWRNRWQGSRGHGPLLCFYDTVVCCIVCTSVCIVCTCVCIVCIVVCIWWTCVLHILHYRSCQGVIPQHLVGKYYIVPAQVKNVVEVQLWIIELPAVRKRCNATMHFFDISLWFNILSSVLQKMTPLCTVLCVPVSVFYAYLCVHLMVWGNAYPYPADRIKM